MYIYVYICIYIYTFYLLGCISNKNNISVQEKGMHIYP